MQPLVLFSSAVVPGLALMWFLHTRPQYPQPRTILWATFGLGVLVTIPVIILGFPISPIYVLMPSYFYVALARTILGVAILEESFKYWILAGYSCQRKRLAEPFDGVVYGVVASLGFATLESIAFVIEGDVLGAGIRVLTSVPAHAALGAIMGYYIAQGTFNEANRGRSLRLAWVIPVVLHILYDFPLLLGVLWLLPLSLAALIVMIVWAVRIIRRVKSSQRRRSISIWGELGSRDGQFSSPHDVALDPQGNMYLADTLNNRVQKLSTDGEATAQWGNTGQKPGEFRSPRGLTIDGEGQMFVSDTLNHRIQKLSAEGQPLRQWGEQGSKPGQFRSPGGVAVNSDGEIFVADTGNHRIQKLSANGELLNIWGSSGGEPGEFRAPTGIAVDHEGWIYVTDSGNHRVQKLSAEGEPTQQWGEEGSEPGQFRNPSGIALDRSGRIYVVDTWNNRVQELSAAGEPLFEWGPMAAGKQGLFSDPCGIAVDEREHVYVADTGNHCVHKLHPFSALMSGSGVQDPAPSSSPAT